MTAWLMMVVGLGMLMVGGDVLVRGAVGVARKFNVSPMLIGLTLVGFGTSTPELLTSVQAALAGSPGLAVGNVVGSNIANILLICGLAAVIRPLVVSPSTFRRDGTALAVVTIVAAAFLLAGTLGSVAGIVLLAGLLAYVLITWRLESSIPGPSGALLGQEAALMSTPGLSLKIAGLAVAGGLALTLAGATFLVSGAIEIAGRLGVSETVIGLTIVAIGTSLQELVTSVMAAIQKQSEVALGNIIGSNIFNLLGILGVTSLVQPLTVPQSILSFDVWIMLAVTGGVLYCALTGWRIGRGEGAALLAGYGLYVGVLAIGATG